MLYTIENDALRVQISSRGGELWSVWGKATDTEYLWQGDAAFWEDRSPILFPVCGRIPDFTYTYGGKRYDMPLHGFLQTQELCAVQADATSVTLRCTDTPETRALYPFAFAFSVTYALRGSVLSIRFSVRNTGDGTLIFGLGAHPGFRIPMAEEAPTDYDLFFTPGVAPTRLSFSARGLLLPETEAFPVPADGKIPFTHRLLDGDSIFLVGAGDEVSLLSRVTGRGVKLSFAGFPYLGFWHPAKTDAPFLCIEPWESLPSLEAPTEALETKPYMTHLPAGETHQNGYTIEFM